MNTALARRAIRNFPKLDYNSAAVRHLRREWLKSVERLGDKWILATPKQRIAPAKSVLDAYDEVSQADYFDQYGRPVPF